MNRKHLTGGPAGGVIARALLLAALITAVLALIPGPAAAAATCPTVDPFGVVTPAPSPGVDWSGCDLYNANLRGADLNSANLAGTNLSYAHLNAADLAFADLTGARLYSADLTGANVIRANLTSADLTNALLIGADLYQAQLDDTVLDYADLTGATLRYADLSGVSLRYATIEQVDLIEAHLHGADLTGAALESANLAGADLTGAYLDYAALTNAYLVGANLTVASAFWTVWTGATCPDFRLAEQHEQSSCLQPLLPLDATAPADAPVVSGTSGNNGWYTSDVSVAWNWTDAGSGIDPSNCTQSSGSGGEGSAVVVSSSCQDLAGNAASDSSTFKIDKTAPTVRVTDVTDGAQYVLGSVPAAGCSSIDGTSGVATAASVTVTTTGSNGLGSFTATCSRAADNAGNEAPSVSAGYSVVYAFGGFFAPVDNPLVVNVAKAGHAIPVKFSLGGDQGLNIFAAGYPKSQQIACDSSSPLDDVEQTVAAGSSSLSYDATTDQYTYVWKTDKAWAGTCRQLTLRLSDGTDHIAYFNLK
jgi:uncharacterized protein YjbI with pentapeptide repeats